jgi:hypothetical protein
MTGPSDDALLADLARLLRPRTEPPAEVVDAAKELFTWRTIDAELAALTYDSLLEGEAAGARASAQPRILTFEADGLTVEVEVDSGPGGRRLLGQLVPAQAAELELRSAGEPVHGSADELGRFVIALPPTRQRVSLRCRTAGGATVDTAWIFL